MQIMILTLTGHVNHEPVTLHPVLIQAAGKHYLIDCGYAETFAALQQQIEAIGINIAELDGILISHDDIDHLGALQQLKETNPNLKVYCSTIEEASVSGSVKAERLLQAEASLPHLPIEHKAWATGFINQLHAIQRYPVDSTLVDNELFENELQVVHTPGHTAGHLSFFYPANKTLIACDAVVIEDNGELNIANPAFTLDLPAAISSIEKIRRLRPEKLICYHGGMLEKNIDLQLEALIERYKAKQ